MRKILIILCLITAYTTASAKLSGQAKIDSLLSELPNSEQDTNKVNLLMSLSFQFYSINPDKGIEYGNMGVELAKQLNWKKGLANCYNSLGINNSIKSNFQEALKFYLKALELNEELGNKKSIAANLGNIGIIYSNQSDYTNALEYYFKALKIFEEVGDKSRVALNIVNIGSIYSDQSDYPKASEYFFKAIKIFEEVGDLKNLAIALGNIGNIYYAQSDYPKALEYHLKSLEINEEIGNKFGIATSIGSIGSIYQYQSNYPKALEYLFKAIKIFEDLGVKDGVALSLANIGSIYTAQTDYEKALEYFKKSIKIKEKIGDIKGIASTLANIGTVYISQSDYTNALEYFRKALKIYEEIENKNGIATTLGHIGNVHNKQMENSKALEYYNKAINIMQELGDKRGIGLNFGNMGSMYLDFSQDSILNKVETPTALVSLNKDINLNNSIKFSTQAVELLDSIGELHARSGFLKNLSDAYKQKGDYKNSDKYLREHIVLKDSVFNQEKAKELGYMTAERDRLVKDRELEEEARKKAKKIAYRNNTQYLSISIFIIFLGILMMLSGKIQMSEWVARGLVFITFILLFEFILVVIDPITDDYSEGEPFIKLGINLCIAFVLFPIHHFFNRKVSKILIKKGGGTAVEKIIKEFNEKKNA